MKYFAAIQWLVVPKTLISIRHAVTAGHYITGSKPINVALGDSDVTTDYDSLDAKSGLAVLQQEQLVLLKRSVLLNMLKLKLKTLFHTQSMSLNHVQNVSQNLMLH